jgi:hypothetical protein
MRVAGLSGVASGDRLGNQVAVHIDLAQARSTG